MVTLPQTLRDSNRLRQMVALDFEQIQASVGEMLVDRPRFHVVPSKVVADRTKKGHRTWLETPAGKSSSTGIPRCGTSSILRMSFWNDGSCWGWGDPQLGSTGGVLQKPFVLAICHAPPPPAADSVHHILHHQPAEDAVFPVTTADRNHPPRGATPFMSRVAPCGRRWQTLLPLGVSGGDLHELFPGGQRATGG